MTNSRSVANIMKQNVQASSRRVLGSYQLGQLEGSLRSEDPEGDYWQIKRVFGFQVLSNDSNFGGSDSNYAGTQVITPETNAKECPNQIDCIDMGASPDCTRNPAKCDVAKHVAYLTKPVFKKTPVNKLLDGKPEGYYYDGGSD